MSKPAAIKHDVATYQFTSYHAAWDFVHECTAAELMTGWPEYLVHTVKVSIRTSLDREAADKLANGAPVVAYNFKGEVLA
jgi:pterin-4a-carbinolamine dehydratase